MNNVDALVGRLEADDGVVELGEYAHPFTPQGGDVVQAIEAMEFEDGSLSCDPGARFRVLGVDAAQRSVRLDPLDRGNQLSMTYPGGEVGGFNGVCRARMDQVREQMMRVAVEGE